MPNLLILPDDLFSNNILKYLPAVDLWRLRKVCRRFYGNDSEGSLVQREFKERDEAFLLSQKYTSESPIMSILDHRQRVSSFERCSAFAWEMTRQAQRHEASSVSCRDPGCSYLNLHARVPRIANGLRNGKHYLFFAQFTCKDMLVWQGFLQDYNPQSDLTSPIRDLISPAGNNQQNQAMANAFDDTFVDFYDNFVIESDVRFHLDARNVTHLTKDHVNSDLHVTLISLIHSAEQPSSRPELKLHYSSGGIQQEYPETPSPNTSLSIDVLNDQYVMTHYRKHDAYGTPFLLWQSRDRLFTFSMLYNFEMVRDADERPRRPWDNMDGNLEDVLLNFLGNLREP